MNRMGLLAALDAAVEALSESFGELLGTGNPIAACYVDGALMSLRIARRALAKEALVPAAAADGGATRVSLSTGLPTGATAAVADDGLWDVRLPVVARDLRSALAPDLGSSLIADPGAREFVRDAVNAAFALDTLARLRWSRPSTHSPAWLGRTAARAVITTMRGGRPFDALSSGLEGLAPERGIVALIGRLGWSPDADLAGRPAAP